MRLPLSLLDAVKAEAHSRGIPYTRYVRMLFEKAVDRAAPAKGGARPRYG
jgi:predicted DNA binding CopG/RHH family protein